jgi:sugar-specific transcriptional regulator TrmB
MNEADDLETVLVEAGFSGYEAEAYVGLLGLRDATVGELAQSCSVPRSRLYDVLRNLEDEGYIETYEQGTLRARIANVTPTVRELRDRSENLRDAAEELEDRWNRPRFQHTDISVFQTASAAVQGAVAQVEAADHAVQLCASGDEVVDLRDTLAGAIDAGVAVRIAISDEPETAVPADLPDLFPSVATEVRRCETNMPFVALVDGSVAVFAIDNEWDGEYGLVVDDNTLTSILHWFFQLQLWEPWDTLYSASVGGPEVYVSVRQLIRDIEALRTEDEAVRVLVEGVDTHTSEVVEFEGEVVEVIYTDIYRDHDVTFAQQFMQASLRIRTDSGREYTVGGYGAVLEDIRAIQITILDIE